MQIELIETFLDLIETRSFNRSADRLGVTQSTVSARIRALEELLGRRLFTRSRAGTSMTAAGRGFTPHARSLRHGWREAQRATQTAGNTALSLRIGLQSDLAGSYIGNWVTEFRDIVPGASLYLEPDFSTQMCTDLESGDLDLAVLYTPRSGPDLFFQSVGEVRYVLVSTEARCRAELDPDRYIFANYAPAFDHAHRAALPECAGATVASGQDAAVSGLLAALGGSAFVLEDSARSMVADGRCHYVADVEPIPQSVFAAVHVRHRHAHVHRRLLSIVRRHFGARIGQGQSSMQQPE